MKKLLIYSGIAMLMACTGSTKKTTTEVVKVSQDAEIACGHCLYDLDGDGCALAVKVGDQAYYVDGMDIKYFGDMHAEDGLCSVSKKAHVEGEIVDGKFKADKIEVLTSNESMEEMPGEGTEHVNMQMEDGHN